MNEDKKCIQISGQNNRYQIKKITKPNRNKCERKTQTSEKWTFDEKYYEFSNQLNLIKTIHNNDNNTYDVSNNDDVIKIVSKQIKTKILSYKQQDTKKKNYDENSEKFKDLITFETIVSKMTSYKLLCHYCNQEMKILYKNVRESSQWTVDRIDNDLGHINSNCNIVCLKCNLKRRRQSDDKYLFTSKLELKKMD